MNITGTDLPCRVFVYSFILAMWMLLTMSVLIQDHTLNMKGRYVVDTTGVRSLKNLPTTTKHDPSLDYVIRLVSLILGIYDGPILSDKQTSCMVYPVLQQFLSHRKLVTKGPRPYKYQPSCQHFNVGSVNQFYQKINRNC